MADVNFAALDEIVKKYPASSVVTIKTVAFTEETIDQTVVDLERRLENEHELRSYYDSAVDKLKKYAEQAKRRFNTETRVANILEVDRTADNRIASNLRSLEDHWRTAESDVRKYAYASCIGVVYQLVVQELGRARNYQQRARRVQMAEHIDEKRGVSVETLLEILE